MIPNIFCVLSLASDIVRQNVVIIGTAGGATNIIISKTLSTMVYASRPSLINWNINIKTVIRPIRAIIPMNLPAVVWNKALLFFINTNDLKIYPYPYI